jgi:hypothetical protein
MEIGSPEWIREHANQISRDADGQLMAIAEAATKRYKVDRIELGQENIQKIALALSEIQHQSFMLGIQMGLETAKRIVSAQAETPTA